MSVTSIWRARLSTDVLLDGIAVAFAKARFAEPWPLGRNILDCRLRPWIATTYRQMQWMKTRLFLTELLAGPRQCQAVSNTPSVIMLTPPIMYQHFILRSASELILSRTYD